MRASKKRWLVVALGFVAFGHFGCSKLKDRLTGGAPSVASAPAGSASAVASAAPVENAPPTGPERVPRGYVLMQVGGVAPTTQGNAVVLTNEDESVGIPIFIGGTEALSIALRLRKERYARPLTHDLLDSIVDELGGSVASVRVDKIQDQVFHGTVLVRRSGRVHQVDARPSDAIALAIGSRAPIHVSQDVVDRAGVDIGAFQLVEPQEIEPERRPKGDRGIEL